MWNSAKDNGARILKLCATTPPDAYAVSAPLAVAGWLLRVAVAGFCLGAAATIYAKLGSGIGTYFFLQWGVPHAEVAQYERAAAALLLLAVLAALIRPHWGWLAPLAVLVIAEALARRFNGGAPFFEWTPFAHALRYLTPLALLALFSSGIQRRLGAAPTLHLTAWLLRIGLAVVFAAHGLEAFNAHPRFIDFLIGTAWNFAGYDLYEETATTLLQFIGVLDLAVAVFVMFNANRWLLFWMAFWGLITAASRVTTFGAELHYEFLLRFPHFLAPLALWLLLRALNQCETPPKTEPAKAP